MRTNIPFIKYKIPFAVVSAVAVAFSLYLVWTKGLNLDTDFVGGRKLLYQFGEGVSEGKIRDLLGEGGVQNVTVRQYGEPGENRFTIRAELPKDDKDMGLIHETLVKAFGEKGGVTLHEEESVGPKAGKELRRNAEIAVLVSCLLMLIYIGLRFDFMFAPGAIVALIHDVLITVGAISLAGRSFSLTSVAALLTILGYSMNDTIVLYDRIRENIKKEVVGSDFKGIVNLSINQVLSRTIITTLTVFFVVVVLFFVTDGEIQEFGFAMIVGVIAGTYSTIFIASPIYLAMRKWKNIS